jgi:adenine-specific DNA methylase
MTLTGKHVGALPTTRYTGSKAKIIKWIWKNIHHLKAHTVLDALGGTGVVGYYAKMNNKHVTYNDYLTFNYYIGLAIIENDSVTLNKDHLTFLLKKHKNICYPTFIQENFRDIYYTDKENEWLDMIVTNIRELDNEYTRALAYYALVQSCIAKRPFNLFHRKNLYLRFADVKRNFGNKATWDKSFPDHFITFTEEVNSLVFSNGMQNKSFNMDIFDVEGEFNLVYIDTPYFSSHSNTGVDYHAWYHFLEGIVTYDTWEDCIDYTSKHKKIKKVPCVWTNQKTIRDAFDRLFKKFKDSILVVSYRSGGIPDKKEMVTLLERYKDDVIVKEKEFKYVLSANSSKELLFIGT